MRREAACLEVAIRYLTGLKMARLEMGQRFRPWTAEREIRP